MKIIFRSALLALLGLAAVPACLAEPTPATHRIVLSDASRAATEQGRMDLKYLARCALGKSDVLSAQVDGTTFEFPGGLGLAPQWAERPMTEGEAHWVSACMFSLTNRFGAHVKVSLSSPFKHTGVDFDASDAETAEYSAHEGTFFGNVFGNQSVAYVCGPRHDEATRNRLFAYRRVCALPRPGDTGASPTPCGFKYVGACTPQAFEQDGVRYEQAISVHLLPGLPPPAP